MKKLLLAFQFLTIIPLKRMDNVSEKDVGGASAFFPLVGTVQGILLVITSALFLKVFPVEVSNGIILLLMIIINGGLHLDGLADTFDAIASRKGKEKKLAIMKDSAVGPFGVIAIVFAILLKYIFLNAIFNISLDTYYLSLFLMPIFSRWAMVTAIFHCKSARKDGLGRIFVEHTKMTEFAAATLLTLVISLLALFISDKTSAIISFLLILVILYIFCIAAVRFSNKNFGGMTGDTFGAVSEISEILFLMGAMIWSQKFI
ncbi:MAG: adenosylcobinamide-GDP ribazoletransferase [Nitrospirae bacterium]|nr:adenosylcobinamide-GDP ribazoletransferase [Nitrospirota bacterium]